MLRASNIVPAAPACLRTEFSQAEAKSSGPCDMFGGRHNGGILPSSKFRILRHWIRNFETDNENVRSCGPGGHESSRPPDLHSSL